MDGPSLDRLDLRLDQGTSTKLAASIYSTIQMRDFEREREKNECTSRIKDGNGCDSNRIRIGLTEMFPHGAAPARPLGPVYPVPGMVARYISLTGSNLHTPGPGGHAWF